MSRWLLCSDGVTDMLSLTDMEAAMGRDDLATWGDLFGGVMEAGARDNFSIIVVTLETVASDRTI